MPRLACYASRMRGPLQRLAERVLPERLVREAHHRRIERDIARYPRRVVEHRYGGVPLRVALEDSLAEGWYDVDWPTIPELDELRRQGLSAGMRVFDLGAHQGVIALLLAHIVGPGGSVVAVEAGRHNARLAEVNRRLNAAENVVVMRAAAGDGSRSTVLFVEDLNGRVARVGERSSATEIVKAVSVDELAERYGRPDLVVVDVEGFEGRVLAGARRVLEAAATTFFVEVHAGCGLEEAGGSAEEVLGSFDRDAYRCFVASALDERADYRFRELAGPGDLRHHSFLVAAPRGGNDA
jgi:FkbM family methyltransferase